MTREELKKKLQNKALREQFNFEVKEREAIMAEKKGEFQNTNAMAFEATIQAWMMGDKC